MEFEHLGPISSIIRSLIFMTYSLRNKCKYLLFLVFKELDSQFSLPMLSTCTTFLALRGGMLSTCLLVASHLKDLFPHKNLCSLRIYEKNKSYLQG